MRLNLSNYTSLCRDGLVLVYDGRAGTIIKDSSYQGGYKVNGRSIKNILEEHDAVYLFKQ